MTEREILRSIQHDEATAERIRMVAKVQRKRTERNRTLERRSARFAKFVAQGRI